MKDLFVRLIVIAVLLFPLEVFAAQAGRSGRSSGGYKSYRGAKAIDGDTYRYKGQRYRLRDYNAPEKGQPGSQKATRSLQKRLDSGQYQYKGVAKDQYGRTIVEERRAD